MCICICVVFIPVGVLEICVFCTKNRKFHCCFCCSWLIYWHSKFSERVLNEPGRWEFGGWNISTFQTLWGKISVRRRLKTAMISKKVKALDERRENSHFDKRSMQINKQLQQQQKNYRELFETLLRQRLFGNSWWCHKGFVMVLFFLVVQRLSNKVVSKFILEIKTKPAHITTKKEVIISARYFPLQFITVFQFLESGFVNDSS